MRLPGRFVTGAPLVLPACGCVAGALLPDTHHGRNGTARRAPVDLGPIEVP